MPCVQNADATCKINQFAPVGVRNRRAFSGNCGRRIENADGIRDNAAAAFGEVLALGSGGWFHFCLKLFKIIDYCLKLFFLKQ